MTTSMVPETGPQTRTSPPRRPAPSGVARIAVAYVLTLISVGVGALLLVGALFAGQSCDLEGFACLGWMIWGALAGAALASVILIALSLRQRMGILFPIIMIGLIILAVVVPGVEVLRVIIGLVAPGVAAWITGPKGKSASSRTWLLRGLVLLVLIGLAPIAVAVKEVQAANYRESLYVKEGVQSLGWADDTGWTYRLVMEDVVARGFNYELVDGQGRQLQVATRIAEDSNFQPPHNCSSDPGRSAPCETRADGVFRSEDQQRQHRIVVRGSAVAEMTVQAGVFDDAELDRLAVALQPQSARWLAERECTICRVLP